MESKSHELYLANNALQQSDDAIASAKNYTENILRSLMNAASLNAIIGYREMLLEESHVTESGGDWIIFRVTRS